ncbi:hypothetical protein [Sulfurimonas sp.]|nr:hypothetical protein [Sulfurimonas sp.]
MMIWLIAFLLLSVAIYVIYRFSVSNKKDKISKIDYHYTFKI